MGIKFNASGVNLNAEPEMSSQPAAYKIARGFYRVTMLDGRYSNIHYQPARRGRAKGWHADIRNPRGELVRYAGIWPTLRAAEEEVAAIFARNP